MSFFSNLRNSKHVRRVWGLLRRGDAKAALGMYESCFGSGQGEPPPALTAACMLERWLADPGERNALEALQPLVVAAHEKSQVRRTWDLVQQIRAEKDLAARLNDSRRAGPGPQALKQGPVAEVIRESAALQALAWCMLIFRSQTAAPERARAILEFLPQVHALPESLRHGCARLFVLAAAEADQWNRVLEASDVLQNLDEAEGRRAILLAAYGSAQAALTVGDASAARQALAKLGKSAGAAALRLGQDCIALGAPEVAAEWFGTQAQTLRERAPGDASIPALELGSALALMAAGLTAEGRLHLATLGNTAHASSDVAIQASLVAALSWLADCSNAEVGDAVANRALWRQALGQLQHAITLVDQGSAGLAWRADVLRGLMAWADKGSLPDADALARFSLAVANAGASAGNALRAVEASLLARSQASEEALELLQRGDTERLRELRSSVLSAQSASVPPAIRAAVALHFWRVDPQDDPLPELLELARDTTEPWLDEAIREVRVAQLIAQLSRSCRGTERGAAELPALGLLADFEPALRSRVQLVVAALALHKKDVRVAEEALSQVSEESDIELLTELRCQVAWRLDDANVMMHILSGVEYSPRLARFTEKWTALRISAIRREVKNERSSIAIEHLRALVTETGLDEAALLSRLVLWLLELRAPGDASRLLAAARAGYLTESAGVAWMSLVLEALCAAAQDQYARCVDVIDELQTRGLPNPAATGSREDDAAVAGWMRLLRIIAQVAALAGGVDTAVRWRSARTALLAETRQVSAPPLAAHTSRLTTALLIHASGGDLLADDQTMSDLAAAQRTLSLRQGLRFVDQVLQDLQWRRSRIQAFWESMRRCEFPAARQLFHEEVLPACRQRVPAALRAAAVLADWATASVDGPTTQAQITALEGQEAGLSAGAASRLRAVLKEWTQVRELLRLLRERRFEEVLDRTHTFEWLEVSKGSSPLAVAAIQLLVLYRLQRMEKVEELNKQISTQTLPAWIRDASGLLAGYAHFSRKQYAQAAESFSAIPSPVVQGHVVARDQAVCDFNNGVQLLGVDQQGRAFEAFSRALKIANVEGGHQHLAPLFLHFGLEAINTGQGARARQAFALATDVLDRSTDESPETKAGFYAAQTGVLLCDALTLEDVEAMGGDTFLKLREKMRAYDANTMTEKIPVAWPAWFPKGFDRAILVLAVCQELRRERRRATGKRQKPGRLREFLLEHAETLEELADKETPRDPLVRVLKGVVRLRLDRKGKEEGEALEELQSALRLGVQSPRLMDLLETHRKSLESFRKKIGTSVDLMDFWLASPDVPDTIKSSASQNNDMRELFRLHRHYDPSEVVIQGSRSLSSQLDSRIKNLAAALEDDEFKQDSAIQKQRALLKTTMEALVRAEKEILSTEREVLQHMAAKLRSERLPSS